MYDFYKGNEANASPLALFPPLLFRVLGIMGLALCPAVRDNVSDCQRR